ncbi:MAG TPA: FGGY family carbohydrate kinase [Candidatus Acidoferrales bacterium]|nr:FGGY family carbohydrate kinase [Candidatus Acidoferrales bacterium]
MNILAIDQGTSATKALVVSSARGVIAVVEVPVHPTAVATGGVEQDPEEFWHSVLTAGREAVARAACPIGAVGLANQGETVLAWERTTGRPLCAALSWQDRRATAVCANLTPHAERLRSVTGLPLDPYFAAPKMRWLREHVTRNGVCTTTDAWLTHRLTGAYVTDAATASRTLLLDLDAVAWSPEACRLFAIDPESLPAVVGCAEPIGETSAFGPRFPSPGSPSISRPRSLRRLAFLPVRPSAPTAPVHFCSPASGRNRAAPFPAWPVVSHGD